MRIKLINDTLKSKNLLVLGVFEDCNANLCCDKVKVILSQLKDSNRFKGTYGEIYTINCMGETSKEVILLGLGKAEKLTGDKVQNLAAKALKRAKELKVKALDIAAFKVEGLCEFRVLRSIVQGLMLGDYSFDTYKSEKSDSTIEEVNINVSDLGLEEGKAQQALKEGMSLAVNTMFARDLVNEPSNILTPTELSERAKTQGIQSGFEVEVFDKEKISELGMRAFLAVGQASYNEPKFIVMRYVGNPGNREEIVGFVGKGLTFDSGGYSLKQSGGMQDMKSDMAGAAAVIGAMSSIAEMKLEVNVVAVIASCENLISGGGYKPGDVIKSMAGKTIEVVNTDCEGRLTLVDALHYIISNEKVSKVIDIATLTGAVFSALGKITTGVLANNDEFYNSLESASKKAGEKIWRLPTFEEYKECNHSDIADLHNQGIGGAGTITAGLFLGEFVGETPWIHLDIAGTGWGNIVSDCQVKGGTGVGVRTLYHLAKNEVDHKCSTCK
ncbi:MAG: leucyl aminopeptidase [Clostridium sp.]